MPGSPKIAELSGIIEPWKPIRRKSLEFFSGGRCRILLKYRSYAARVPDFPQIAELSGAIATNNQNSELSRILAAYKEVWRYSTILRINGMFGAKEIHILEQSIIRK